MTPSQYLHGTDPQEQRRLARMNELLNGASLRELNLRGGEKILDVGCGLAQLTRAMAKAAGPQGRVLGVERSSEQLAEAGRLAADSGEAGLVELRQGDVFHLPLRGEEWGTFDIAHARFVLEHVPDPLAVVREMVRAVRPGGRVVLQDDNHDTMRLWPEPEGFSRLWNAYMESYRLLGNDPLVGHRLVSLLHEAGAPPRRATWIFFGGCPAEPSFPGIVQNTIAIVSGARETIVSAGVLSAAFFDESMAALQAWSHRPDAAMWFALSWAEGQRKP